MCPVLRSTNICFESNGRCCRQLWKNCTVCIVLSTTINQSMQIFEKRIAHWSRTEHALITYGETEHKTRAYNIISTRRIFWQALNLIRREEASVNILDLKKTWKFHSGIQKVMISTFVVKKPSGAPKNSICFSRKLINLRLIFCVSGRPFSHFGRWQCHSV